MNYIKETEILANRLQEVIIDGTWIANTNFKDQLTGTDYVLANKKFHSFNTIAILAQHIHYYIDGIKNVFLGGDLEIRDRFSFDFEPITTQKQWEDFLNTFWKDTEELVLLIKALPQEDLSKPFVDKKYGSYKRNIDAMIEHSYYHLGQVVLVKKGLQ